jgi:hypothetical protein
MPLVPPPFDAEVAAALQAIPATSFSDFTPEAIASAREGLAAAVSTDEVLSHEGFFAVEDRVVAGPSGAPDITLLICRPVTAATPGL